MNILLTGATGLIGTALTLRLKEGGHHVMPLRRRPGNGSSAPSWDPPHGPVRLDPAVSFDAVIHLAGENIACRWTADAKARIRASRVDATRLLCEALARAPRLPRVMVAASATGFYGDRGDEILDERSAPGTGFLAEVCRAWEAATMPLRQQGVRVVHLRLGMVLARHGGALARMLPAFRAGLGGRLGSGRQYWSWVALEDVLRIVELALQEDSLSGGVNTVAPEAATNASFTAALAWALRRPAFLAVPAFVVRALFGEMGREVLLASSRVRPERLLKAGVRFQFSDLDAALARLLTTEGRRPSEPTFTNRTSNST